MENNNNLKNSLLKNDNIGNQNDLNNDKNDISEINVQSDINMNEMPYNYINEYIIMEDINKIEKKIINEIECDKDNNESKIIENIKEENKDNKNPKAERNYINKENIEIKNDIVGEENENNCELKIDNKIEKENIDRHEINNNIKCEKKINIMKEKKDYIGLVKDIDNVKDNENINNKNNIDLDIDDNIENGSNIGTEKNNIIKSENLTESDINSNMENEKNNQIEKLDNLQNENEIKDSYEFKKKVNNNIKEANNDINIENFNMNSINNYNLNINKYNNEKESIKINNDYISNYELTKNIGLSNIGNTCYMNSFLQILLHTPSFLPKLKLLYKNNIEENTLIYNLIKLSEYPKNTKYLYEIKKIISKTYPKYGAFTQNDTQNFAIDFIDTMINEIKNEISYTSSSSQQEDNNLLNKENKEIKIKKYKKFISDIEKIGQKTFIEDLFSFIEYSIKYKDKIDINKITFNLLLNIELTFPVNKIKNTYSLDQLLQNKYYSNYNLNVKEKEVKIETNKKEQFSFFNNFSYLIYTIFHCFEKGDKEKVGEKENNQINLIDINKNILSNNFSEIKLLKSLSKILSLPNILIISFDRRIEGKDLISSYVSFNEKLEMKNYIDKDLYNINFGTIYQLFAINIRQGSTVYSGHCYSYVKIENKWVCFNDTSAHYENPKYCLNSVVGLYYIKDNVN